MLIEALFVTALAACIISGCKASGDIDGSVVPIPGAQRGVNAALLPARGGRNNLAGKPGSVDLGCVSCAIQLMSSGDSFACARAPSVMFFSSAWHELFSLFFFFSFSCTSHKAQNSQIPPCVLPAEGM